MKYQNFIISIILQVSLVLYCRAEDASSTSGYTGTLNSNFNFTSTTNFVSSTMNISSITNIGNSSYVISNDISLENSWTVNGTSIALSDSALYSSEVLTVVSGDTASQFDLSILGNQIILGLLIFLFSLGAFMLFACVWSRREKKFIKEQENSFLNQQHQSGYSTGSSNEVNNNYQGRYGISGVGNGNGGGFNPIPTPSHPAPVTSHKHKKKLGADYGDSGPSIEQILSMQRSSSNLVSSSQTPYYSNPSLYSSQVEDYQHPSITPIHSESNRINNGGYPYSPSVPPPPPNQQHSSNFAPIPPALPPLPASVAPPLPYSPGPGGQFSVSQSSLSLKAQSGVPFVPQKSNNSGLEAVHKAKVQTNNFSPQQLPPPPPPKHQVSTNDSNFQPSHVLSNSSTAGYMQDSGDYKEQEQPVYGTILEEAQYMSASNENLDYGQYNQEDGYIDASIEQFAGTIVTEARYVDQSIINETGTYIGNAQYVDFHAREQNNSNNYPPSHMQAPRFPGPPLPTRNQRDPPPFKYA